MMYVGLLMIRDEEDILERVLATHAEIVDAFYVLDGSATRQSEDICRSYRRCYGYWTDAQLPPEYGTLPRDGWRQFIYNEARGELGADNWFLLLHGDEVWTFDPRDVVAAYPGRTGFGFRLPFYFPRAAEGWDDSKHPLDQLRWRLGPGWPEFRMFYGGTDVNFALDQHFNTTPSGVGNLSMLPLEIKHYPYRAPAHEIERARRHEVTHFDPENYRHVSQEGLTLWDDDLISRFQGHPYFEELTCD